MRQKTGICIVALLAAALLLGIWQQREPKEETTETAQPLQEAVQTGAYEDETESRARFLVRIKDGRLVVLRGADLTVYMETGIRTETLDEATRESAETGIGFDTQEELFSFLESYAS